ncbi:MAG: PHP domain-containing protein [Phycisphaeraceae bacterium]|nr:PHP domain-containing protein [Phycisphaeraceae bacterium]
MARANPALAAIFQQMADVTEILSGDRFRVLAFQKAARILDELALDVAELVPDPAHPDLKKLTAVQGIGKGTAERIVEYLATGKIREHHDLLAQIPPELPALLDLQGVGPKTVALLWKQGGVTSLADLKTKLGDNSLSSIPGLGPKKLENFRQALAFVQPQGAQQRVRLGQAMPIARWIIDELRHKLSRQIHEIHYAGSLRRGKETIGDLDILISPAPGSAPAPETALGSAPGSAGGYAPASAPAPGSAHTTNKSAPSIADAFTTLPLVQDVLAKGDTKCSVRLSDQGLHLQSDLRIVPPESFGAALLYFTGSKEHNVRLRQRALEQGLKLNEYGLYKGDKLLAGQTEEEIFRHLGLDWIPPELREDHGEISLAERHQLPALINLGDIQAELHAHTTASDGLWSIFDLAQSCADRRMHVVAVTDHSKSQFQANGLSEERLVQHVQAIRAAAAQFKNSITILAGAEVDILADGRLDYPDSVLKELDIVVASPHAALTQDPKKATARLRKAIDNRYVTILGHPTGRLILRRPGLAPDIEELAQAAAQRGIALEINANSYRLDLRDTHARVALEAGCKLAINTDAHGPADLDQLPYGILTARRAGARQDDVVNTLPRDALLKWIKSTRR